MLGRVRLKWSYPTPCTILLEAQCVWNSFHISLHIYLFFLLKSTVLLKGITSCRLKSEYFNIYIVNGHWNAEKLSLRKIFHFLSSNNANNISSHVDHSSSIFFFLLMLIKKIILFSRRHYVVDFVRPKITLPQKHVLQEHPDSKVLYDYTDENKKKILKDGVKETQCLFPQRSKCVCTQFLLYFVYL